MDARIMLVEKHDGIRAILRNAIEGEPGVEVVGEARDAAAAAEMTRTLTPDLIVIDLDVLGDGCSGIVRRMVGSAPGSRILALSEYGERGSAKHALREGASGFVLKARAVEELVPAIRAVLAGKVFIGKGPDGRSLMVAGAGENKPVRQAG